MYCPRLDHNVRLNANGTVSLCGHMVGAPQFDDYETLCNSQWLINVRKQMDNNHWPAECSRCKQTESIDNTSIRKNTISFEKLQKRPDYLVVGGVLDNVCNSACMTCGPTCSTKIGSLKSKEYPIYNNTNNFFLLPQDRIVHLDLSGGEPSASKNYTHVLQNLPSNVESLRINTNCSLSIPEIEPLIKKGVAVTITASFDGIHDVHNFVRWPIPWEKFYTNLMKYKNMEGIDLNLWTTISAFNIGNITEMFDFVKQHNFKHSWAFVKDPFEIDIEYKNTLTLAAKDKLSNADSQDIRDIANHIAIKENNQQDLDQYIQTQCQLRGINITDYLI
jgi:hypothetical protein